MSKLCERPGCSEPGAIEYGMVPEDLLFWIAPLTGTPRDDVNLLCRRHADAMSVPRGWTLDDRREEFPRLFRPRPVARPNGSRSRRARTSRPTGTPAEQLVIDGTGEIGRPDIEPAGAPEASDGADRVEGAEADAPWLPAFDQGSDLDGLLEVRSPLLARAFRGTDRRRG